MLKKGYIPFINLLSLFLFCTFITLGYPCSNLLLLTKKYYNKQLKIHDTLAEVIIYGCEKKELLTSNYFLAHKALAENNENLMELVFKYFPLILEKQEKSWNLRKRMENYIEHGLKPILLSRWLCKATKNESINMVSFLLAHGADPNRRWGDYRPEYTPLALAVFNQNYTLIKLLLENKADPNLSCTQYSHQRYETPLIWAIENASIDIVELLLDNGADPNGNSLNRPRYYYEVPLYGAFRKNDPSLVKLLLNKGADPHVGYDSQVQNKSMLSLAYKTYNIEIIKLILEKFSSQDYNDLLALKKALSHLSILGSRNLKPKVQTKLKEIAYMLYEKITDQIPDGLLLLIIALQFEEHDTAIKLIIDTKTIINTADIRSITPLLYAISKRDKKLVECLLNNGADPNMRGLYNIAPLDCAIFTDRRLEQGLITTSHFKRSCLPISQLDRKAIAKLLLDNGAVIDEFACCDNGSFNLFHRAIINKDKAMIKLLLAYGANVDNTNIKGLTALHLAAKHNLGKRHPKVLKYLLNRSQQINQKDQNENTPLMLTSDFKTFELFLEHGADSTLKNNKKQTAMDKAMIKLNKSLKSYRPKYSKIESLIEIIKKLFELESQTNILNKPKMPSINNICQNYHKR